MEQLPVIVSIRCLAYNHEPYIRECLDGFVMQKTNFRFEAIVHDDASTDGTADIIREYAEKYPEIIKPIFETENQYSKHDGSLRRIMDEACTGKYIALCEGDDYWTDPYKLQKQVDFLETHQEYVAMCHNALQCYGNVKTLFVDLNKESHGLVLSEMLNKWCIPTASLLYKRVSLTYPEDFPGFVNGDYAMELLLLNKGGFFYDSSIMSVYRRHEGSVSDGLNRNQVDMYSKLVDLLRYFKTKYLEKDHILFDQAIDKYECEIANIKKNEKYPFIKYLNWRHYKRMIFKRFGIARVNR